MSHDDRETPESPLPPSLSSYDEEITGSFILSPEVKPLARRVRRVERHFEPGGMVADIHADWSAIKKGVGFFKWIAPMIASVIVACIVGIIWLINHAASQPAAPTARDIAHEISQQK